MQAASDAYASVYVARQPILYANGRVFGYELLYRARADDGGCDAPLDVASARVLSEAMLVIGLETLTSGRRAFINVTRNVLLSDVATLLPREHAVIEILESVHVDDEVVLACRRLREMGYTIALDDYALGSTAERLLPYAEIVKVDMLSTTVHQHHKIMRSVPKTTRLVAEKVESNEVFGYAAGMGYHLFQGYYFSKPITFEARALSGRRATYLRLLAALHQPNATVAQVEDLIKHDGAISYRVLRCINSAAFGIRQQVYSIRQALVMLGLDQVRKWASVWALASLSDGANAELVNVAIVRARSCELLAQRTVGQDASSEYFLLGLCSLLDAMLGLPMAEAIADLPVSDRVRAALLGEQNTSRRVLDAVAAYERGRWDDAAARLTQLGLTTDQMPRAYGDALKWARELSHSALAS